MKNGENIFKQLFHEPVEAQGKKGRSSELNERRNKKLLDRYFFYGFHAGKRSDAVYAALELEFDLSARRILDIVTENIDYLKGLRDNPPTLNDFKKKYPFYVWDMRA